MILLISTNPLFVEVIREAIPHVNAEYIEFDPDNGLKRIYTDRPDILIVDATIEQKKFEQILSEARRLPKIRTIVLNPQENEVIFLDSRRAILRKVDDLMDVLTTQENNVGNVIVDCDYSENAKNAKIQACVFNFLATIFNQRPNMDLGKSLQVIGIEAFCDSDHEGNSSEDNYQGIKLITDYFESAAELTKEHVEQELAVDWARLFRGVSHSYGPTPPYESLYFDGAIDQVKLFQLLANEYAEGGAEISANYFDRPDYIGVEFSFMAYLAEQEMKAWESGNHDVALAFAERARSFYKRHLGLWASKYISVAYSYAQTGFYRGFLCLSRELISQIVEIEIETYSSGGEN